MILKITSDTDVYIDSYKDGELDHVNSFDFTPLTQTIEDTINEDNLKDIILDYIENNIYYTCKKEWLEYDEESKTFSFSVLVNSDNYEVFENSGDIKSWKMGKKTLYSSNIRIYVEFFKEIDYSEVIKNV